MTERAIFKQPLRDCLKFIVAVILNEVKDLTMCREYAGDVSTTLRYAQHDRESDF